MKGFYFKFSFRVSFNKGTSKQYYFKNVFAFIIIQ